MNGTGSVTKYQAAAGVRWQVRWDLPEGPGGQRRQRTKRGFTTKGEASKYLRQVLTSQDAGRPVELARKTIAQAVDSYLTAAKAAGKAASTLDLWTNVLTIHVVPRIGSVKLHALTGEMVAGLYATLSVSGKAVRLGEGLVCRTSGVTCEGLGCSPERHEGLGAVMLRHVHTQLRAVLAHALPEGSELVTDTKRARAALPKVGTQQVEPGDYWTTDQARQFLASTAGHRWGAAFALALATGMRRSELAGLRWGDVDLGDHPSNVVTIGGDRPSPHLWVRRTITSVRGAQVAREGGKSRAAVRRVPLGSHAVELLARHRDAEQARAAEGGWTWGQDSPVFATDDGGTVNPATLTKQYGTAAKQAGVPELGIHSARHYAITTMLRSGVPVTTVAKVVGHEKPSITFDVYSHAVPSDDHLAAAAMDTALSTPASTVAAV